MSESEEKLKLLKNKRESFRSQLTLFEKFISELNCENISNDDLSNLEHRLHKIELLYDLFGEVQDEIELLGAIDQNLLKERESFQNSFFSLTSKASVILLNAKPPVVQSQIGDDQSSNASSSHRRKAFIRLPTLNLKNFDGTFTSWREFYDSFKTIIHENEDLTEVQKLSYLKASLKGEPASLLSSFETTKQNYDIAWSLLQKRYNNKRRIINNHVQALLDISQMTRESCDSLRQIINTAQNHIQCLKSLGQPVESWDAILVPIVTAKLDFQTNKEWEAKLSSESEDNESIPSIESLLNFLNNRQTTLEMITKRKTSDQGKTSQGHIGNRVTKTFTTVNISCTYCNENHSIQNCESFLKLDLNTRNNKVREQKICLNCLRKGHFVQNCTSKYSCKKCNRKHNTLLHLTNNPKECEPTKTLNDIKPTSLATSVSEQPESNDDPSTQKLNVLANCASSMLGSQILLSTAKVLVADSQRNMIEVRAMLDSASQSNFITEEMCNKLALIKEPININVTGINQGVSKISHKVQIEINSRVNNFTFTISCLVISQITNALPSHSCDVAPFMIPSNIKLADPLFYKSGSIDLLIGAEMFYELMCVGQIQQENLPTLQKTKIGWVVSGKLICPGLIQPKRTLTYLSLNDLHNDVEKFWQMDEFISKRQTLNDEENYCESFFKQTTSRDDATGKFIVKIPFKPNLKDLGDSRSVAESRFHPLERRFHKDPGLKQEYMKFIKEYITLKHMTKIEPDDKPSFFLPHHAVVKNSSETTKLRVVFDGSCKLESGLSINETQCTGPTIQDDIFSIIARFRTYDFVLTGDIAKMYRQVWVHPNDRQYQRIIWRDVPDEPLQCYELNTVTYGTTAAPFLAIRCLYQLALENERNFPLESEIIKNDFYVDDLLTGSNSIANLKCIKNNIDQILKTSGFILRKWNSNVNELCDSNSMTIPITEKIQKTLGINWNPTTDNFTYSTAVLKLHKQTTKRTILATTAQLFDPLGLLAPIIIVAKLIIQELWQIKLGWDEAVPLNIQTKWLKFKDELKFIDRIQIPRHVIGSQSIHIELHAFSDASERGYGSCIYLRSIDQNNQITVKLLAAKSRVAPLKNVTLPRLELCASVLSAQLLNRFKKILNLHIDKEFYWCDSQIVLCWLNAPSNKWKTYVANRVSEIQGLTDINDWHHVQSNDNSADLISRGVLPSQLLNSRLWWHGPQWLSQHNNEWLNDSRQLSSQDIPELRKQIQSFTVNEIKDTFPIQNYSSINKLKRIIALCMRFKNNLLPKQDRTYGPLTAQELQYALIKLVKITQLECFPKELNDLSKGKSLHPKSNLLSLTPFLDSQGIIRVGGRLHLTNFKYDKKHPILLPKNHHLTNLIFVDKHIKLMHAGPKLLLSTIREQFWPISGKNMAKLVVRKCMKCFRFQPKFSNPIMGTLPIERTLSMPPFHSTGVDYAGPFVIKDRRGRGHKTSKCYISLFVCFSTKALHLELVTDLTTDCFLAALRRFIARRGKPLNVYSDNGTTFIGAKNELSKLGEFLTNNAYAIKDAISVEGIIWHFIPPRSPHFGGLWEAGVKSAKHHLKRVLSNTPLTYEDFYTILTQVESILNSRPLTPLTSDPNDLDVLTPAHFLIGRPFTTIPDPDVRDIPQSRLDRFQHLQQMNMHFWSKWSKEYISELQQRSKWKQNHDVLKIGTMVLIKDDNLPPARWQVGRIIQLHPGRDGISRVATVKCANGAVVKRAFAKISVLPLEQT